MPKQLGGLGSSAPANVLDDLDAAGVRCTLVGHSGWLAPLVGSGTDALSCGRSAAAVLSKLAAQAARQDDKAPQFMFASAAEHADGCSWTTRCDCAAQVTAGLQAVYDALPGNSVIIVLQQPMNDANDAAAAGAAAASDARSKVPAPFGEAGFAVKRACKES